MRGKVINVIRDECRGKWVPAIDIVGLIMRQNEVANLPSHRALTETDVAESFLFALKTRKVNMTDCRLFDMSKDGGELQLQWTHVVAKSKEDHKNDIEGRGKWSWRHYMKHALAYINVMG